MELSDFISDLEQTKILSLSAFGVITGGVAGIVKFDEIIENSKRKFFSEDKSINKLSAKLAISATAGVTSTNYDGSLLSNIVEGLTYSVLFRIGYEAGYQITKNISLYKI
jgi:hypothetical protein